MFSIPREKCINIGEGCGETHHNKQRFKPDVLRLELVYYVTATAGDTKLCLLTLYKQNVSGSPSHLI